jgi:mono/diheme cytochrome c family protein
MRHVIAILLIGIALCGAVFGMLGLRGQMSRQPPREFFSDMDRVAKVRPQEPNRFFANGVSSQLPPVGTIDRSEPIPTANGAIYRFEDSPVNTGRVTGTTNFIATNPLTVNETMLRRGRERFDIYCSPCHGRLGDGNGITQKIRVMAAVANLHDKRIVEMTDGEVFNTVSNGKGLMAALGPQLSVEDRWAVIVYLRALQLSQLGSTHDLTAEQSAALK